MDGHIGSTTSSALVGLAVLNDPLCTELAGTELANSLEMTPSSI